MAPGVFDNSPNDHHKGCIDAEKRPRPVDGTPPTIGVGAWACAIFGALAGLLWTMPNAELPFAQHITHARWLQVPGEAFGPPRYAIPQGGGAGLWQQVRLPHVVEASGGAPVALKAGLPQTQETWYLLDVAEVSSSDGPQYLYIPRWQSDGNIAIYGDTHLLYQSHTDVQWNVSSHPLWVVLNDSASGALPQRLWIRLQALRGEGSALSSAWVGSDSALGARYRFRDWLQTQLPQMSSATFLAAGLFSFFVWLGRRRERMYLLFAMTSVVGWLRTLHFQVGIARLPLSDGWFGWMTVNSALWVIFFFHCLLTQIYLRPQRRLTVVLGCTALVVGVMTSPLCAGWLDVRVAEPMMYALLFAMGIAAFGSGLWQSMRARSEPGFLLSIWSLLSMLVFGVHDWLLQHNFLTMEGLYLMPYANVGAFFIFAYVILRGYIQALHLVEQANASLAARLRERETELHASHERLRAIEHQQTLHQERQRLMQDMHDGLGSSLTSALRAVEVGRMQAAEVSDVLRGCVDDLKLAIDSMEPVQADLLLLLATLRYRLAPRLKSSGITLRWDILDVPPLRWLDPRSALHILRILQEAFANIIRHTQATAIQVRTATQDGGVVVLITDNGPGFSLQEVLHKGGKGLGNQMRRAQAIGGRVHWSSPEGGFLGATGTCMELWLPIERSLVPLALGEVAHP